MRFTKHLLLLLTLLLLAACGGQDTFLETFDESGSWRVGDDLDARGEVVDGVYRFSVAADTGIFWTTAGKSFTNGVYSVEATQTKGQLDIAGFGLMLRVDDENDSFYLFEISGDGFAWIGRCLAGCTEETVLLNEWWFDSDAIKQGLGETNTIAVSADSGNLIFSLNNIEVGRVTDTVLSSGDVGLFVETLGSGDIVVEFDNVRVDPLE